MLLRLKLSNVISVSGFSAVVLPVTRLINVLLFNSSATVPALALAYKFFSISNPVSSLTLPDNSILTKAAACGSSAEAPKLLY